MTPAILRTIFSDNNAHPLALLAILTKQFGEAWLEWESETLWAEILDDFGAPISTINKEKILAARLVKTTHRYFMEWDVFQHVTDALNSVTPNFGVLQQATPGELLVSVDIAEELTAEQEATFTPEVRAYVAGCFLDQDIWYLPPPVDFAQELVSEPTYRCLDCGRIALDDNEGHCDYCSGKYQNGHFTDRIPHPELGQHIVRYLKRDPAQVKQRFLQLLSRPIDDLHIDPTSMEDVQAAKLLAARIYAGKVKAAQIEQLRSLEPWMTSVSKPSSQS